MAEDGRRQQPTPDPILPTPDHRLPTQLALFRTFLLSKLALLVQPSTDYCLLALFRTMGLANWVRFAQSGGPGGPLRRKLGLFRTFLLSWLARAATPGAPRARPSSSLSQHSRRLGAR